MTRSLLSLLIVVSFVFLFFLPESAYSQCRCWQEGIENELIPNSSGTLCEREGGNLVVISLSNPNDFCDNQLRLSADSISCSTGIGPVDPDPPPGINCGPGLGSMGEDPEGICLQEIEEFCDEVVIRNVPALSEWGLIAMAGALGLVGFMVMRRKRATT